MRFKQLLFGIQEVHKAIQRALGYLSRVLQLNGSRSKVAWIGIRWLTILNAFVIQSLKCFQVHKHFTAYLKLVRVISSMQGFWDTADGFYIGGYLITLRAIATGYCLFQLTVFISQTHR